MPLRKAVLMSRWSTFKLTLLAMARRVRIGVGSVIGEHTLSGLKSRPLVDGSRERSSVL